MLLFVVLWVFLSEEGRFFGAGTIVNLSERVYLRDVELSGSLCVCFVCVCMCVCV